MSYFFEKTLRKPMKDVEDQIKKTIMSFKLSMVSEVDVTTRVKKKLEAAKDMKGYKIFGICNAPIAFGVLTENPCGGVFLPCKMIVREVGDEETQVIMPKLDYVQDVVKNEKLFGLYKEGENRVKMLFDSLV